MKRLISIFLITLSLNMGFAQSKAETQVNSAVERLKDAMISGDRKALENIASEDLSYGHSGGKIEDKKSFVESIASGKSDFVSITLSDQTVKVSGKTAIVRHKLSAETKDGGKPGTVNLGIMLIFQKKGGEWRLLARQAVKVV